MHISSVSSVFLRQEVEEFFYSKDRDFDGYLSFEEFIGEESHMEKLFKKMDKNKDGKVSKLVSNKNMMLLGYIAKLSLSPN